MSKNDLVPGSLLGDLSARRDEILEHTLLQHKVPRWSNPDVWIEFKPIDYRAVRDIIARVRKSKADQAEAELNANADLLIRACVRVYAKLPDDDEDREFSLRPNDPLGPVTTFDADLAESLGLDRDVATARQICRTLFLTDGDLTDAANRLIRWSGIKVNQATGEVFEGEA